MEALVTLSDLSAYKYVMDSVKNTAVWPQFVDDAQCFDVKPFLGDPLLSELIDQASTSPTSFSTANQTLLNGGKYTYELKNYLFRGLKACIIFYAFSRYGSKSPYNHTALGIVQKTSDYSDPVSDKTIQRLSTDDLMIADAIREEILLFLKRNSTTYPLFECANTKRQSRTFTVVGD
jgi:hypothetical protein